MAHTVGFQQTLGKLFIGFGAANLFTQDTKVLVYHQVLTHG
jgi:hypothetical protein